MANEILDRLITKDGTELTLTETPFDYGDNRDYSPYTLYQVSEGHNNTTIGIDIPNLDVYRKNNLLKCGVCGALIVDHVHPLTQHVRIHTNECFINLP